MTFHFELCNHPNKKGDYSVFLLVFHKGQKKRIKTSILIPDRFWDPVKERVRKTCPSYQVLWHTSNLSPTRDAQKTSQRQTDYIFPYLDNEAEYAKYIDYEDRKIMPLEVSRKYFDTINARQANVDNTTLKNILQHSSLNTTETYVKKLDSSSEDAAMKVMYLDQTHHNKEKKRIIKQIKKLSVAFVILYLVNIRLHPFFCFHKDNVNLKLRYLILNTYGEKLH